MTHFQKRLNQLDAVEQLLWIVLALMVALLLAGGEHKGEERMRVKAANNSEQAQLEKIEFTQQLPVQEIVLNQTEDALYPPKRIGFSVAPQGMYPSKDWQLEDGRGDNFWCILVKNSCYKEQDVEQPKSFFVTLWNKWFSTDEDDTHPQDGDKLTLQEG